MTCRLNNERANRVREINASRVALRSQAVLDIVELLIDMNSRAGTLPEVRRIKLEKSVHRLLPPIFEQKTEVPVTARR